MNQNLEENVTLEYLLQKYFGLKNNLFLAKPKLIEYCDTIPIYDPMTNEGHKAYKKMIDFIYDLDKLAVDGIEVNKLVTNLDEITNEI